jgi:hypothetical protein
MILDAATAAFLRNGYLGTSMDEIAARARVSKQTRLQAPTFAIWRAARGVLQIDDPALAAATSTGSSCRFR